MKIDCKGCIRTIGVAAAGLLTATALATPAHAQVTVYIGSAPPPVRYEARPRAPGPGFSWIDGFYEPYRNQYRWHPGYWQQPPFQGAYYVHPHYDHYPQGWRMHEGYWAHEDHSDHYWDNQRGNGNAGRDDRKANRDERKEDRKAYKDERKDERKDNKDDRRDGNDDHHDPH